METEWEACIMKHEMGGWSMIQLLIIADDFTGALDTGVQFATTGAVTRVITGQSVSLSEFAGTC